ncbi:hypothetical protein [Kineosporia sp. NBRC 101731]|uniref:hypothetical protein n=1 Tax=Kineosporia sp. NBRC 101731 TaxID=3032199 RepID=UPI0024A45353|nr:hypothetical protein [Kineosporia sp. NBRC 101731]GLY33787.1 hypothetical protein Kisp02_71520 [Kineosporia sp. NBRC 101731]
MADKITINEAYLKARITDFTNFDTEAYNRLHTFNWGGNLTANLTTALRMGTGKDGFTPGKDLYTAAEGVRSNFSTRMTQFKEQSQHLYSGLQDLLDDQEEIQSLNNITASEFGDYVGETTSGLGTTTTGNGETA